MIYLDHNATTPVAPEVAEAMWPYLTTHFGNPSSDHPFGRAAKAAVDTAREQVAALIGAHPDEIVFTSGGTESNNLAIRGTAATCRPNAGTWSPPPSSTRPPSQPVRLLAEAGWQRDHRWAWTAAGGSTRAPAWGTPRSGWARSSWPRTRSAPSSRSPSWPTRCTPAGRWCTPTPPRPSARSPSTSNALGVDLLSIAGHKCYAPKGVGALYVRRGTPIAPVLVGAGQEHGVRPGTENVASIVGLGAACALAGANLATEPDRIGGLRDYLWELLSSRIPHAVRLGDPDHALPNTLSISIPGRRGLDVLAACPDPGRIDRIGLPHRGGQPLRRPDRDGHHRRRRRRGDPPVPGPAHHPRTDRHRGHRPQRRRNQLTLGQPGGAGRDMESTLLVEAGMAMGWAIPGMGSGP